MSPKRIFEAVATLMDESKVLAGKTRRALDSTVLDDAVARQDTVTMLATQIRRVRKLIPELVSSDRFWRWPDIRHGTTA